MYMYIYTHTHMYILYDYVDRHNKHMRTTHAANKALDLACLLLGPIQDSVCTGVARQYTQIYQMYIYICTHTHTHTQMYMYMYVYV